MPALDFVVATTFYGAAQRPAGLRLVATDTDRTFGDGDREVRGPVRELLLVATGRRAGLDALDGPGVEDLASSLG